MIHGDVILYWDSSIARHAWDLAMSNGAGVAVYTSRSVDGGFHEPWCWVFVRSLGEPAELDPEGAGQRPGLRHPWGEYARYEPEYDEQFFSMLADISLRGDLTAIVPSETTDQATMSVLGELCKVAGQLNERYYGWPRDKRKNSERSLRDIIRPIPLPVPWILVLGLFHPETPIAVFLAVSNIQLPFASKEQVIETW